MPSGQADCQAGLLRSRSEPDSVIGENTAAPARERRLCLTRTVSIALVPQEKVNSAAEEPRLYGEGELPRGIAGIYDHPVCDMVQKLHPLWRSSVCS